MELTDLQRATLAAYQSYRVAGPTIGGLFAASWKSYLWLLAYFVFVVVVALSDAFANVAWLVGGVVLGVILRDFGSFRMLVQVWPALSTTIDWKLLENLLEQDAARPRPGRTTRFFTSILRVSGGLLGFFVGIVVALLVLIARGWSGPQIDDVIDEVIVVVGLMSAIIHWWLGGLIGAKLDRMRREQKNVD